MRRYLYALIPIGFVIMVGLMVWIGRPTGGPAAPEVDQIETDPLETEEAPEPDIEEVIDPDTGSAGFPSPSGPEYGDNETILDEVQD